MLDEVKTSCPVVSLGLPSHERPGLLSASVETPSQMALPQTTSSGPALLKGLLVPQTTAVTPCPAPPLLNNLNLQVPHVPAPSAPGAAPKPLCAPPGDAVPGSLAAHSSHFQPTGWSMCPLSPAEAPECALPLQRFKSILHPAARMGSGYTCPVTPLGTTRQGDTLCLEEIPTHHPGLRGLLSHSLISASVPVLCSLGPHTPVFFLVLLLS